MAHLQDLFVTHLGKDVVLFTNNGCSNRMLACGTLPGMLSTLDFGGGYAKRVLANIILGRRRSFKEGMNEAAQGSHTYRAAEFIEDTKATV